PLAVSAPTAVMPPVSAALATLPRRSSAGRRRNGFPTTKRFSREQPLAARRARCRPRSDLGEHRRSTALSLVALEHAVPEKLAYAGDGALGIDAPAEVVADMRN